MQMVLNKVSLYISWALVNFTLNQSIIFINRWPKPGVSFIRSVCPAYSSNCWTDSLIFFLI